MRHMEWELAGGKLRAKAASKKSDEPPVAFFGSPSVGCDECT
jgi:hypothetical protein